MRGSPPADPPTRSHWNSDSDSSTMPRVIPARVPVRARQQRHARIAPMSHDPLKLLDRFVAREGHALVPKGHIEEGFALGQWVAKKRFTYQQQKINSKQS